ncbi:hypothetical protein PAPHI01_2078 [Pancytospora philotis]|nr:hypothetical protein PAPHI01_2078 [Pancytospora philotis]
MELLLVMLFALCIRASNPTASRLTFQFLQIDPTSGIDGDGDIVPPPPVDVSGAITVTPNDSNGSVAVSFNTAAAPAFDPALQHVIMVQGVNPAVFSPDVYTYAVFNNDPSQVPFYIGPSAYMYNGFIVAFTNNTVFTSQVYTFVFTSIATSLTYEGTDSSGSLLKYNLALTAVILKDPTVPTQTQANTNLDMDGTYEFVDYSDPSLGVLPAAGSSAIVDPTDPIEFLKAMKIRITTSAVPLFVDDCTLAELKCIRELTQLQGTYCRRADEECPRASGSRSRCRETVARSTLFASASLNLAVRPRLVQECERKLGNDCWRAMRPADVFFWLCAHLLELGTTDGQPCGTFQGGSGATKLCDIFQGVGGHSVCGLRSWHLRSICPLTAGDQKLVDSLCGEGAAEGEAVDEECDVVESKESEESEEKAAHKKKQSKQLSRAGRTVLIVMVAVCGSAVAVYIGYSLLL